MILMIVEVPIIAIVIAVFGTGINNIEYIHSSHEYGSLDFPG